LVIIQSPGGPCLALFITTKNITHMAGFVKPFEPLTAMIRFLGTGDQGDIPLSFIRSSLVHAMGNCNLAHALLPEGKKLIVS
jgi:hypothetical protein